MNFNLSDFSTNLHSEAHTYLNTFAILKDTFKINLGNDDKTLSTLLQAIEKKQYKSRKMLQL